MSAALKLFADDQPDWSREQLLAIEKIQCWRSREDNQVMTLGGYAGTGKTTITAHLAKLWPNAAVCAYTGKAASVLRSKGVNDASTIHGLIYRPAHDHGGPTRFIKSDYINASCILVDEASMVDRWIHKDLKTFRKPILYIGDHGQLEPVMRHQGDINLMADPDIRLETVHRQAADNPILRLAAAFREGRDQQVKDAHRKGWRDKTGRVTLVGRSEWRNHLKGQVICGTNRTRHEVNQLMRKQKGYSGMAPNVGERVICLQNNQYWQIYNGQMFTVEHVGAWREIMDITVKNDDGRIIGMQCLIKQFGKDKFQDHRDKQVVLFDFGNCLTGHKAQGSEYDEVTVIEEIAPAWNAQRWRYTTTTRAKERLVYCG